MLTEDPRPCPKVDCIVEGLNDPDDLNRHLRDDHGDPVDSEGFTREYWLVNNRTIAELEGLTSHEIFVNQIATRLGLEENIRIGADWNLGHAYIACLAHHEARGDYEAEGQPWAPLGVADLDGFDISTDEADVIVQMANGEYAEHDQVNYLADFMTYLDFYEQQGGVIYHEDHQPMFCRREFARLFLQDLESTK